MNQNNNQVQQGSQVSQEDLAKTQVLNLNDVKELAKFERKTSKRPAILFIIAGVLSITLGFSYSNIMMTLDKLPVAQSSTDKTQPIEIVDGGFLSKIKNEQVCKVISNQNADGTKGTATYTLEYNENNQLQNFTMVLTIDPLTGNSQGVTATQGLYNAYKALDNIPLTGYKMTTTLTGTSMKAIATVDLTKLDKTTLTSAHTSNFFAQVPFNLGDSKEAVTQILTSRGVTCE